ncbi:hypothetical protein NQX30_05300 [Candidatus Persebacteraceae bacterium Df01]|uniref:Uncharacterized protein n=1 Tax=Candidatus Doriopsillibacter californiensis TaxID=2970740 RepID=A0ABT7QM60_9GAMM|nr:hypothetical protein [Candidatus Persebacteraceae bacterium Df01]
MNNIIKLPSYGYLCFFCQSINLIAAVISVAVVAPAETKYRQMILCYRALWDAIFIFTYGTHFAFMLIKKYERVFLFTGGVVVVTASTVSSQLRDIAN